MRKFLQKWIYQLLISCLHPREHVCDCAYPHTLACSEEDAQRALSSLDNSILAGQHIHVKHIARSDRLSQAALKHYDR
jgi:hypothetical protein